MLGTGPEAPPPLREEAILGFQDALRDAFAAAADAVGATTWTLDAGVRTIELRFAGPALIEPLLSSLPHARPGVHGSADTVVLLWDTESTGVSRPQLPWHPLEVRSRGDVKGFNDERFGVACHPNELTNAGEPQETVQVFDAEPRVGVYWTRAAERLRWWERAAPMRGMLRWVLAGPGTTLVHAGTVGRRGAGVMLAGASGAGKTSTTLAAVVAGAQTAGDDTVMLDTRDRPVVHGVYAGSKVEPRTLDLLPALASAVPPGKLPEQAKLVVDVARAWPDRWASRLDIRGIVVPTLGDRGPTRVTEISGGEALLAVAPSTMAQFPGDRGSLASMAALARAVPSFRLELGGGPAEGAAALEDLLSDLAS